jgi:hypothetical protein
MKNAIKIAAVLAIVGAVAVVALAGESLANTGSAGNQQGMMSDRGGSGMMSGQGCGHMGASYGSANDHPCNGDCPVYGNATACQDHASGQIAQNNCGDRCDQDTQNCTCDNQCACCDGQVSSVTSE